MKRHHRFHTCTKRVVALATFAILLCLPALAPALPDYSKGILDIETVMKQAADVSAASYPNADDVLVDDYILVQYEPDGTAVTWDDTFMKVLTEKGRRANETLSLNFALPYGKAAVKLMQVIKPDGTVIPVDVEKQSRVSIDRSQMSANIYNPNLKILQVGVPGLEIGDVVRYVSLQEIVKPRVVDTWADYRVFEYTSPIKHYVYEVLAPKELPLQSIAHKGEVPGTVTYTKSEKDGRLSHKWDVKDVPRMYEEPSMPELHTVTQRLLVSTTPNWRDLSKWYWNLSKPHFDPTDEMKAKVTELVQGAKTREEKIRAIFKFVSQEIRYMGITVEKDAPGYEPHDVKLTFENRHGVCRDKAALLVVMLRLADLKGYPVLIHSGPKKDEEVPQPYFNHAITAVENDDGTYTLMDSTDENTKELFPAYLCNMSYLVAKPEGETLLVSPIIPAAANMLRIDTTAKLDAAGNLVGESTLEFNGINDNAYRGFFSRSKPEERRRYFEGAVKRLAAGARLTDLTLEPADMLDTSQPVKARIAFEAKDILVSDGSTTLLPVPRLGRRVGLVNFVLGQTGLDKRQYPFRTNYACGVRETLKLELDPALGAIAAMPQSPELKSDTLSWKQKIERDENTLSAESEFLITAVEFSPEQYLALKETLKKIEFNERKMPILKASAAAEPAGADVIILSDELHYQVQDAHNWTTTRKVRKKVLTYSGKKDNSEIKIAYNPVWEDVKLVKAVVTTGEKQQEISEQEINIMDAGWVGAAPRYPAGKTFVASLPGVELGSVIEYEIDRTFKNRPFLALIDSFRGLNPIQAKSVSLEYPHALKFKSQATSNKMAAQVTREGETHTISWAMGAAESVKDEDSLPPWWSFNPTLFLSTGDWKTYAAEVGAALSKAAANQPQAAKRAKELVANAKNDEARITAIRDFVAKGVRGAGPGLSALPLSAVTPADRTLADGYGNSTDQAVLLHALLEATGFKPEFVLASGDTRVPELQHTLRQFPTVSLFSTVLVRVKLGGADLYLNDTSQYAVLGATSHDGHMGLSVENGEPLIIRAQADRETRSAVRYHITLAASGDAQITKTMKYYGAHFAANNRQFSEMPPEERRRYFLEAVAGVSQAAKADGDLETDFESYPGVEIFSVTVEKFAVRDGEYLYFNLPGSLRDLLGLRADKRTNPLYWEGPRRTRVTTTVRLPEELRHLILKPKTLDWQAPGAAGAITVRELDPGIAFASMAKDQRPDYGLECEVDLKPAVIDADAYASLLEINRQLSHTRARTILLGAGEEKAK